MSQGHLRSTNDHLGTSSEPSVRAVPLHVLNNMRVDSTLEAMAVATVLLGCGTLDTHWVGAVGTGPFADGVGLGECALYSLVLGRQKDDLGVCGFGHGLHGFEVSDLHSRRG